MADDVDTPMDAVQAPLIRPGGDRARTEAEESHLRRSHHAVLLSRNPGDRRVSVLAGGEDLSGID